MLFYILKEGCHFERVKPNRLVDIFIGIITFLSPLVCHSQYLSSKKLINFIICARVYITTTILAVQGQIVWQQPAFAISGACYKTKYAMQNQYEISGQLTFRTKTRK